MCRICISFLRTKEYLRRSSTCQLRKPTGCRVWIARLFFNFPSSAYLHITLTFQTFWFQHCLKVPLVWWIGTLGNVTFLNTSKPKMKQTLLLAALVFLLKEASSYPAVTADKEPSKGRELERRSAQENEETAGELICETNCEGRHSWLGGQLWLMFNSNSCTSFRLASRDEWQAGGNGHCSQQSSWGAAEDWSGAPSTVLFPWHQER